MSMHTQTEHIFAITTTSQLPNACDFAGDIQGDILRKIFFVGKDKYSAPGIVVHRMEADISGIDGVKQLILDQS